MFSKRNEQQPSTSSSSQPQKIFNPIGDTEEMRQHSMRGNGYRYDIDQPSSSNMSYRQEQHHSYRRNRYQNDSDPPSSSYMPHRGDRFSQAPEQHRPFGNNDRHHNSDQPSGSSPRCYPPQNYHPSEHESINKADYFGFDADPPSISIMSPPQEQYQPHRFRNNGIRYSSDQPSGSSTHPSQNTPDPAANEGNHFEYNSGRPTSSSSTYHIREPNRHHQLTDRPRTSSMPRHLQKYLETPVTGRWTPPPSPVNTPEALFPEYQNHIELDYNEGYGELRWITPEEGMLKTKGGKKIRFTKRQFFGSKVNDLTSILCVGLRLKFRVKGSPQDIEYDALSVRPVVGKEADNAFNTEQDIDLLPIPENSIKYDVDTECKVSRGVLNFFKKKKTNSLEMQSLTEYFNSLDDDGLRNYAKIQSTKEFFERRNHLWTVSENTVKLQFPCLYSTCTVLSSFLLRRGGIDSTDSLFDFYSNEPRLFPSRKFIGFDSFHFFEFLKSMPFVFSVFPNNRYVSARRNLPEIDYPKYINRFFPWISDEQKWKSQFMDPEETNEKKDDNATTNHPNEMIPSKSPVKAFPLMETERITGRTSEPFNMHSLFNQIPPPPGLPAPPASLIQTPDVRNILFLEMAHRVRVEMFARIHYNYQFPPPGYRLPPPPGLYPTVSISTVSPHNSQEKFDNLEEDRKQSE